MSDSPPPNPHGNVSQHDFIVKDGGINIGVQNITGLTFEEVTALFKDLQAQNGDELYWNGEIPYKGLNAFEKEDAKYFFGREQVVDRLLDKIAEVPFLTVSGPSGSGKSSVIRAGLFYALAQGHEKIPKSKGWTLASMKPGNDPFEGLSVGLAEATESLQVQRLAKENHDDLLPQLNITIKGENVLVLLVDQFEELFTQKIDLKIQKGFVDLLVKFATAEKSKVKVILSLRSDFISNCFQYPDLIKLIKSNLELIDAMNPKELTAALTLPAFAVGAKIDPDLVDRVITDMSGEPGALPLMSFAMRDLFIAEKTHKGKPMDLTLPEYIEHGGINDALAKHAEKVYASFKGDSNQQALVLSIFSKLITVGEGRADTRRITNFKELVPKGGSSHETKTVVDILAQPDARLLTVNGEINLEEPAQTVTVTIAHERLIDAWPRLRTLVDKNRGNIRLLAQINRDSRLWAKNVEDRGYLYQGGRLSEIEERWENLASDLSDDAHKFYQASLKLRQDEIDRVEEERQKELDREKERVKLRNRWLMLSIFFLVITIGFGVYARLQQLEAEASEAKAVAQTTLANAQRFQRGNQLQLSTLLAAVSLRNDKLPEADDLIRQNISQLPTLFAKGDEGGTILADFVFDSNDQTVVVAIEDRGVASVSEMSKDGDDFLESKRFESEGAMGRIAVSDTVSNSVLAAVNNDRRDELYLVTLFDLQRSRIGDERFPLQDSLGSFEHAGPVRDVAISENGMIMASTGDDGTVRIWKIRDEDGMVLPGLTDQNQELLPLETLDTGGMTLDVKFVEEDQFLLTGGLGGYLWDAETWNKVSHFPHNSHLVDIAYAPGNAWVATAGADKLVRVWDAFDADNFLFEYPHRAEINAVGLSLDGGWLATASEDGAVRLWEIDHDQLEFGLQQLFHDEAVVDLAFHPTLDQPWLATLSEDRTARLWDLYTGQTIAIVSIDGEGSRLRFSSDGRFLATTTTNGLWRVWDLSSLMTPQYRWVHAEGVTHALFGQDDTVYFGGDDAGVYAWDLATESSELLHIHSNPINSLTLSENGSQLASVSEETITIWRTDSRELERSFSNGASVTAAAFQPAGDDFLTTNLSAQLINWDLGTGTQIYSETVALFPLPSDLLSIAYQPDGASFATGTRNGTVLVRSADDGSLDSDLPHGEQPVLSVAYLTDADGVIWLLSGGEDGQLLRWDVDTLRRFSRRNEYRHHPDVMRHPDAINMIDVDQKNNRFATAGEDGVVRIWSIETWREIARIPHSGAVSSVRFSETGDRLVSTSENGVYIWLLEDIPFRESRFDLVSAACDRVSRDLLDGERLDYIGNAENQNSLACEDLSPESMRDLQIQTGEE